MGNKEGNVEEVKEYDKAVKEIKELGVLDYIGSMLEKDKEILPVVWYYILVNTDIVVKEKIMYMYAMTGIIPNEIKYVLNISLVEDKFGMKRLKYKKEGLLDKGVILWSLEC